MTSKNTLLNVGDKVRYTALFLQSTGQLSGTVPFMRGVVTGYLHDKDTQFPYVDWGDGKPSLVNSFNICRISDRRSYAD